ncbi:hypothetical protein P4K84_22315 [Bacillus cereus]|uniref:hypothetical protein n=1 Tax=Bacillus cereus TaxID=1396 RepID=UPI000BFA320E|nr:hypothetical protein [Bacillus cereus]MEB9946753.1 hypothetical protein [Bacillus cereus]PFF41023.1 hypothetical protein CN328_18240 [Bacillus cereus]PGN92991.1 hypothetical protein CN965_16265 [Bacillus cereus]PGV27941.1 hypothetical protein COD79_26100 [Bacillus cereus]PGX87184.1 hypothetical protein COE28_09865 [Bacillus cereus]
MSKVHTNRKNPAIVSLITDPKQIIPMDACVLIPPNRSKEVREIPPISFEMQRKFWLDTLFRTFPSLAIHEAVLKECFFPSELHTYLQNHIGSNNLLLLKDSDLSALESSYRDSIEIDISNPTNYKPELDNSDDRGEVKSLAHIKTKNYPYFCSRDSKAIRLIDEADRLKTNLQDVNSIQTYEMMYYLTRLQMCKSREMKPFYKYLYHLTSWESKTNPEWGQFLSQMDLLYGEEIKNALNPDPISMNN